MTSLFIDPALFEAPSEPEPRDQLIVNGRYMLPPLGDPTGKRRSLQRVTNLVKQLSEQDGLVKWKLRMTVVGLAKDERLYDLATSLTPENKRDLDDLIEKAIDLGQAGPSGGNITGTALHNYTDDKPGEYPIRVRDKWVPKVENYYAALHAKGLRVVPGLSERLVVSERYGTAGRLDDIYEDPFGELRVGDRKSQKAFYTWWEVGAQLACYQGSDAMWNEEECRWEDMPKLADDYVHVAWMPLNHPTQRDGVTIYDLPLGDARLVLEECVRVRELRRGAKSWGRERMDLGEFARCARDIRDAETRDDLRKIHAERSAVLNQDLIEMAAKRWEKLVEVEAPEPVSVDIEQAAFAIPRDSPAGRQALTMSQAAEHVRAMSPSDVAIMFGTTDINLNGDIAPPVPYETITPASVVRALGASAPPPVDFECRFDGKRVSEHPINVPGQFHCMNPVPRPLADQALDALAEQAVDALAANGAAPGHYVMDSDAAERLIINGTREAVSNFVAPVIQAFDATGVERPGEERMTLPQDVLMFDPALFAGPEDDATFPMPGDSGPGRASGEVPEAAGLDGALIGTASNNLPGTGREYDKLQEVTPGELFTLATELDRPNERGRVAAEIVRRTRLGNRLTAPQVHAIDDAWAAKGLGPLRDAIRDLPAALTEGIMSPLAPEALQQTPGQEDVEDALMPTLESVPLKIVREIATRAGNSSTARGRVRLLNDIESNKPGYVRHWEALIPAVLAEWLAVDGGPSDGSDGPAGTVRNTEGSKRQGMYASQAGPTTLTAYLATKEEPKSGTLAEAQRVQEATSGVDEAAMRVRAKKDFELNEQTRTTLAEMKAAEDERQSNDEVPLRDGTLSGDRERILPGTVAQVRQKYLSIVEGPNAGKHTIARLVELAKEARDGHERAQAFEAITKFHRWTGAIASEINRHYLDNGYATENFDPYFEAQDRAASTLPLDPDDPATAQDAIHRLGGVRDRAALTLMWQELATKPFFADQALQEALMSKLTELPK